MLELFAQRSQAFAAAGCEKAEVAHLDKAFGQHMLQETVDERFGRERAQLDLTCVRHPVVKDHLVVLQLDQAAVADRYSDNIGRQEFKAVQPLLTSFQ